MKSIKLLGAGVLLVVLGGCSFYQSLVNWCESNPPSDQPFVLDCDLGYNSAGFLTGREIYPDHRAIEPRTLSRPEPQHPVDKPDPPGKKKGKKKGHKNQKGKGHQKGKGKGHEND